MSDREAELKITAKTNFAEAQADTVGLRKEVAKVGDAGEEAAQGLKQAEAAVSSVGVAEQKTAAASEQAAAAIREVGAASKQTGAEATAGSQQATQASQTALDATKRQADATETAGEAAKAAGATTVTAVEKTQRELTELTQRWEQVITAAKAAGRSFDSGQAVSEIQQLATAIRNTGTDLGAQRTALKALADSIEKEYRAMAAAAEKAGTATVNEAKFTRDAMKAVTAAIVEVDAALAATGGSNPFPEIKSAVITFEGAATNALSKVNDATEQLNETFRITPRQLKVSVEAVEALRIALDEQTSRGVAGTQEQLTLMARLETQITELTLRANQFTNASSDNAVRLKETGVQVQGVAMGVQQLTSMLGPHAAQLGMVIGNVGQLGGLYESLKDSTKGLDLNTLGAASSAAKLGTQLGLVGTTAIAATAAGVALARTSEENKEATDDWWKSVKSLGSDMVSQFGAIQSEWNKLDAAQQAVWAASEQDRAKALADMAVNHEGYLIALNRSKAAVDLYWTAIQAGIPMVDASRAAHNASAEALQFYATSATAGAEGQAIMLKVIREANGDQEKMNELVRKYTAEMERASRTSKLTGDATKDAAEASRNYSAILDELSRVQSQDISKMSERARAMGVLASLLRKSADATDGASEADRERLDLLVNMYSRYIDLSDVERDYAATLLESARAGEEVSLKMLISARASLSLGEAVEGTSAKFEAAHGAVKTLTEELPNYHLQLGRVIARMQDELDSLDDLTEGQRRAHQEFIDRLKVQDEARKRSADLATERTLLIATAENELKNRTAETTREINERLDDLAKLVPFTEQYGDVTAQLGEQLRDIASTSVILSRSDRERLIVIADLVSKGHALTAGQRQLAVDLIAAARAGEQTTAAMNALARIQSELDTAVGGTTATLTETIGVIRTLSGEWGLNSAAIRVAVGELQSQLDSTDRLTTAQRALVQSIIDATNKQLESATAVKASVTSLVAHLKTEAEAYTASKSAAESALEAAGLLAATLHGTADAYTKVDTATRKAIKAAEDSLAATKGLSAEERNRAAGIIQIARELDALQTREAENAKVAEGRIGTLREEIAALQAKIDLQARAAGLTQEQTEIDMNAGASIDYLRQKQAALTQQLNESIVSWAASREATEHQVDAKAKLLEIITKEKTAQELLGTSTNTVATATSELTKVVGEGIASFNASGEAQRAAAEGASAAAVHVQTMSIRYRDGSVAVREFGVAADEIPPKIQAVADKANETAPIISAAFAKWLEEGNVARAKSEVDALNASLATMLVNASAGDQAMFRLTERIGAMGAAAAKAAGGDNSYVNVTEGP